jgi:L-asparaginase
VIASRCGDGATALQYGYDGGGVTLQAAGAIFAGDLTPAKARIKLMVLLGTGADDAALRSRFPR